MKKNRKGFTFVELLVTVSIIAVLMAIGAVNYASTGKKSRDAKRKADLESIRSALELYRSDNGSYPSVSVGAGNCLTASSVIESVNTSYMNPVPLDPKDDGGTNFCYKYIVGGVAPYMTYEVNATLESGAGDLYRLYNP